MSSMDDLASDVMYTPDVGVPESLTAVEAAPTESPQPAVVTPDAPSSGTALFSDDLKPDSAPAEEPEVTPEAQSATEAEPEQVSHRAAERIRKTIAERNAARDELRQMQAEFQRQQMAMQQQLAEQQAKWQQQQLELENRRVSLQEQRYKQEEEAGLSEVERARRAFMRETAEAAKAELQKNLNPAIEELKAQLAEERAIRERAVAEAEQQRRYQAFAAEAQAALDNELLRGMDPDTAGRLKAPLEEMLYSFSGAYGVTPSQALPGFKKFLNEYAQAQMRRVATGGATIAKTQRMPASVPSGMSGAGQAARSPTLEELQDAGFVDHIQWAARGRPAIPRKR